MHRLIATPAPRSGGQTMWRRMVIGVATVAAATTFVACGFGTAPGPPYDFSRLEPVVEPILHLEGLTVIERRERGTDCHGMSCARPVLTYELRSDPPATFERIQEILSSFVGVTKPFTEYQAVQDRDLANPRHWGFAGEVLRRAVTVSGDVAAGGKEFRPGAGTAEVIRIAIATNRLVVP